MQWLCSGYTVVVLWLYSDYTVVMLWLYSDYTVVMLWLCSGYTVFGILSLLKYDSEVFLDELSSV